MGFELGDVFELGIAILVLPHAQILEGLAVADIVQIEELLDDFGTGGRSLLVEAARDFFLGEIGPKGIWLHGIAGRVFVEDLLEVGIDLGLRINQAMASTPFFRHRSAGTSGRFLRSRRPRRMVLGSQPTKAAI